MQYRVVRNVPGASHSGPNKRFGGTRKPRFSHGKGKPHFTRAPRGKKGQHIDVSKFINKAVITEQVEHFVPEHKFADFAIDERLKASIAARGYVLPTPIQDRSIPHILRGSDIVGIANTGTGKTGAFLIPLVNKILNDHKQNVLIMAPTRELAIQIDNEFKELAKGLRIYSVCAVGGAPIGKQIRELRLQHNLVIGTPGRIKDLVEQKYINLGGCQNVVLDEADRMLDMGFIADMKFLLGKMPTPRHTLFFSATLSPDIEKLIHDFLKEPVRISVKTRDTAKNVDQDVVRTAGKDKLDVLHDLLVQPEFEKVIIFGRTKHGVEKLSHLLEKRGFSVESIHGDKDHKRRQRALGAFKENKAKVLVATDVAARGLDIPNVTHVINYDIPQTYDDYVHRIGRTGRGNKTGKALTFID